MHIVCVAAATELRSAMGGDSLLSPRDVLGFDPCEEGAVVDAAQAAAYLKHAASRSDRVRVETIGLSVEGRPIICAFISSAENLRRIEEIRSRRDKLFALVTCGVHPAEVGTTPAGLVLLHRLVAELSPHARQVLDGTVIILVPCMNPDGTDRVAQWLRAAHKPGASEPDGSLPFPQHRFTGHDLNRDWMLGTQPEVRAVIEQIHNKLRPWVTIDLHEMGSNGPRVFIPPYADPVDPAVSLDLLRQLDLLGSKVLDGLARSGRRGAARRWTYDAWSPSRAYPLYHGGLRFLVEAASGRFTRSIEVDERSLRVFGGGNEATDDYPAPWRGGRWGLPQITDYLVAATELALEALLEDPLRSGQEAHIQTSRAREAVRVDDEGADSLASAELRRALELGGADVRRPADGKGWIAIDPQWGKGWCRSLLLCEPYTFNHAPYDTAAHELAGLAGVRASLVPLEGRELTPYPQEALARHAADVLEAEDVQILCGEGSSSDEGWLRWVLEEHRFRFRRVLAEELEPPTRGQRSRSVVIAAEGTPCASAACVKRLKACAEAGGRVIAFGRAAREAARLAQLPIEEAGAESSVFSGTLLKTRLARDGSADPLLSGYAAPPGVFYTGGPLWKSPSSSRVEPVLAIDRDAPILCGAAGPSANLSALVPLVRVKEGDRGGEWILFGFSPHYRAWSMGTFRLLFNAVREP